MKKIKILIELTYPDDILQDPGPDGWKWFEKNILRAKGDEGLILHSNFICDEVGRVKYLGRLV